MCVQINSQLHNRRWGYHSQRGVTSEGVERKRERQPWHPGCSEGEECRGRRGRQTIIRESNIDLMLTFSKELDRHAIRQHVV